MQRVSEMIKNKNKQLPQQNNLLGGLHGCSSESLRLFVAGSREAFFMRGRARGLKPELMELATGGQGKMSYSFPCFLGPILSLTHSRNSRNICQMRPQLSGTGCRFTP